MTDDSSRFFSAIQIASAAIVIQADCRLWVKRLDGEKGMWDSIAIMGFLITSGCDFIGSNLTVSFRTRGNAVMVQKYGRKMHTDYTETNRIGDHIWWISDVSKFASHHPAWHLTKTVRDILSEIHEYNLPKWKAET